MNEVDVGSSTVTITKLIIFFQLPKYLIARQSES